MCIKSTNHQTSESNAFDWGVDRPLLLDLLSRPRASPRYSPPPTMKHFEWFESGSRIWFEIQTARIWFGIWFRSGLCGFWYGLNMEYVWRTVQSLYGSLYGLDMVYIWCAVWLGYDACMVCGIVYAWFDLHTQTGSYLQKPFVYFDAPA